LNFSPDGSLLAAGGIGLIGNIDHLEARLGSRFSTWRKGQKTHEFAAKARKGWFERLIFLPDGERIISLGGANDGFVWVLDLKMKTVLAQEKPRATFTTPRSATSPETLCCRRVQSARGL